MTTRLDFCKREIEKCKKDNKELGIVMQELVNLLPTYKEKAALHDLVKEMKKVNA